MSSNKNILNAIFIGHVDAGKSTLGGQILSQLSMIDERTLANFKSESSSMNRESWYLSWALDTNPEERERGKTTELAKFRITLQNKTVILIDSPGHAHYQTDVISGASLADIAILIISAKTGEFEAGLKGQTMKHVLLVRAIGVKRLLVLVNKMDDAVRERYDEIILKMKPKLMNMFGNVMFIPISGYKGINIKDNQNAFDYYQGPAFLQYLNDLEIERKGNEMMFLVDDVVKNLNTCVGKLESGSISKNDQVLLLPSKVLMTVISIYDDEDVEIEKASEGDNIKIKVKNIGDDVVMLVDASCNSLRVCTEIVAELNIVNPIGIISPGYRGVIHIRNLQKMGKIKSLGVKKEEKIIYKPFVKKGDKVLARIIFDSPVVVYEGSDINRMDWFLIRDQGNIVAVGKVKIDSKNIK